MKTLVGLTGGIGSGKTTIANFFKELGVPIYIADTEAKALMNRSKVIKRKLIALFGDNAYQNEKLNRDFLSKQIFNNKDLLQKMNAIVHPKVASHFKRWVKKQEAPYVISEAAILFENGSYKKYDYIITVTAPEEVRLKRVMSRDNSSKEKVKSVMNNQWKDEEKIKLSDYVIQNINLEEAKAQVLQIHQNLLQKLQKD
ncbi:dephospho-CoA kinase [Mesoflavibacter sabulilitoris]|uniref:Dephospho-CoA kinase n=1 Tax=Mesoflavibacter zeaxanthinifaciens subsp. sabulilitoris TaxID=1520893 RepID=A0A2T1NHD3_9FLAO|nr:dephospho-CoA kinase [Mesoflavibacter zeaxanthinifaciens]MBB3122710.1 dephospho-CoA kinase [Mesoflavibacter zeaxanthinifaciens subsp. sabulilitoris]PSG92202.1 dephospho-CoA kinase [Mesoflavibacter zeaxanthinifaciens subsp. sabulilitoris]